MSVLTYSTGVTANDTSFKDSFPFVSPPWSGTGKCSGLEYSYTQPAILPPSGVGVGVYGIDNVFFSISNSPNPFLESTTIHFELAQESNIRIEVFSLSGKRVGTIVNGIRDQGKQSVEWSASGLASGTYIAKAVSKDGKIIQAIKLIKS